MRKALLVLGGSPLLAGAGCATLGPRLLKGERGSYNLALQYTNNEQLLLNLVRLRYRDTPVFLEVSSLSTQFAFEASTQAGAELNDKEGDLFTLGTATMYATRPTVTYTLLQGEDFSQRLLSPLSVDTLMLLSRSGWPLSGTHPAVRHAQSAARDVERGQPREGTTNHDPGKAAVALRR